MHLKELLEVAKRELQPLTTLDNPDFRLEQAEFKSKEDVWEVVVSFLVENTERPVNASSFPSLSEFKFTRLYKRLIIDANKNVFGMYMFES